MCTPSNAGLFIGVMGCSASTPFDPFAPPQLAPPHGRKCYRMKICSLNLIMRHLEPFFSPGPCRDTKRKDHILHILVFLAILLKFMNITGNTYSTAKYATAACVCLSSACPRSTSMHVCLPTWQRRRCFLLVSVLASVRCLPVLYLAFIPLCLKLVRLWLS